MITYQKLTPEYVGQVKFLCQRNNISFPLNSEVIFIALDEHDTVIGVTAVKKVFQVEPLISSNPIVAHVLSEKALAVISLTDTAEAVALVRNVVDSANFISQLERSGFVITDTEITILKKEV